MPIDGVAESIAAAHPAPWQMVSGGAGSVVTTRSLTTDISGLALSTYYLDQRPASPVPCAGDAAAWRQNGIQIAGAGGQIPCTDPTRPECPAGTVKTFTAVRYRYFAGPSLASSDAAALASHALNPVQVAVTG